MMDDKKRNLISLAMDVKKATPTRGVRRVLQELVDALILSEAELESIKSQTRGTDPDPRILSDPDDAQAVTWDNQLRGGGLKDSVPPSAPREPGHYFDEQGRNWLHSVARMPGQEPHFDQWYDWRGQAVPPPETLMTPVGGFPARKRATNPHDLRERAERVEVESGLLDREEFDAATAHALRATASELEALHSWDGLMELLDEHWPSDVFPFYEDDADRDAGPRIVSLIRALNATRQEHAELAGRVAAVLRYIDEHLKSPDPNWSPATLASDLFRRALSDLD